MPQKLRNLFLFCGIILIASNAIAMSAQVEPRVCAVSVSIEQDILTATAKLLDNEIEQGKYRFEIIAKTGSNKSSQIQSGNFQGLKSEVDLAVVAMRVGDNSQLLFNLILFGSRGEILCKQEYKYADL